MKKALLIVFAFVVLLIILSPFAAEMMINGLPLSKEEMSKVHAGMSQAEVLKLLGDPDDIDNNGDQARWVYSYWFMWQFVAVDFHNEKVVDISIED